MEKTSKEAGYITHEDVKEFSPQKLMDIVNRYSFPRKIGSNGEIKARRLAYNDFKKMGYKPQVENFLCSLWYSQWLLRFALLNLLIMLLLNQIVLFIRPALNIIVYTIFILWGAFLVNKTRSPHKILYGKVYRSANIFGFVPAKTYGHEGNPKYMGDDEIYEEDFDVMALDSNEDNEQEEYYIDKGCKEYDQTLKSMVTSDEGECQEPSDLEKKYGNIIISAHTDSKSQSITTIVRIKLFYYNFILFGILSLLYFITIIIDLFTKIRLSLILEITILLMTIIVAIFTLALFLNKSENKSPGALDNASGIAVVLGLAEHFKKIPLERFNLWFVLFGVEEFGQMGARNFVLKRLDYFKRGRTFNINLDMVSSIEDDSLCLMESYGFFKKPVDPLLENYIKQSSKKEGVKVLGLNLPTGAHTDRMVFTKYGFNGIDFVSATASKWTHSPQDTPDKVNADLLSHACRIIASSLKDMDNDLKNGKFMEPKDAKHLRQHYY
ncbi:MAG: M28 family metallopeptidase [Promethearchaeota archaeon]